MKPATTTLSLQKNTVAILTQLAMTNYGPGATSSSCPPPDTDSCIGCNSITPDNCDTAQCILSL